MHWLPLVAMVIASALPFPHSPVSRIAAATTESGPDPRRDAHRHEPRLAAPPPDHALAGNASHVDYNMAAAQSHRRRYGQANPSREVAADSPAMDDSDRTGLSAALRTEDVSRDDSVAKDFKVHGGRRPDSSRRDFSNMDAPRDSTSPLDRVTAAEGRGAVSPTGQPETTARGGAGSPGTPERTAGGPGTEGTAGRDGTLGIEGTAAGTEDSLTLAAGLGLGLGLDGVLDGDEMFLDAHPRVLFSPSPSPPLRPPLLLLLETGLQAEEDGDGEEREDLDRLAEGHGDHALDGGSAPSWAPGASARPARRDKRSHMVDRRRGEKSVCESESRWVTDKKMATDSQGQKVTVLQEIQTQTGPLKQYFYETRCRQAEQQSRPRAAAAAGKSPGTGVAGAGCLGVDRRQWVSECKAKQSFVRALTKDANSRIGWRWIRIDSSCVCVLLSRTNQQAAREEREGLTGRGRG